MGKFKIGDEVELKDNIDNENYNDIKGKILIITNIIKNGIAYDRNMYPQGLNDLKYLYGGDVNYSLYDYELQKVNKSKMRLDNKYTVESLFNLVKSGDVNIIKNYRYGNKDRLLFSKPLGKFVYYVNGKFNTITQKEAKSEISMILTSWKSNKYLPLSKLEQEKTKVEIINNFTGNIDTLYI